MVFAHLNAVWLLARSVASKAGHGDLEVNRMFAVGCALLVMAGVLVVYRVVGRLGRVVIPTWMVVLSGLVVTAIIARLGGVVV